MSQSKRASTAVAPDFRKSVSTAQDHSARASVRHNTDPHPSHAERSKEKRPSHVETIHSRLAGKSWRELIPETYNKDGAPKNAEPSQSLKWLVAWQIERQDAIEHQRGNPTPPETTRMMIDLILRIVDEYIRCEPTGETLMIEKRESRALDKFVTRLMEHQQQQFTLPLNSNQKIMYFQNSKVLQLWVDEVIANCDIFKGERSNISSSFIAHSDEPSLPHFSLNESQIVAQVLPPVEEKPESEATKTQKPALKEVQEPQTKEEEQSSQFLELVEKHVVEKVNKDSKRKTLRPKELEDLVKRQLSSLETDVLDALQTIEKSAEKVKDKRNSAFSVSSLGGPSSLMLGLVKSIVRRSEEELAAPPTSERTPSPPSTRGSILNKQMKSTRSDGSKTPSPPKTKSSVDTSKILIKAAQAFKKGLGRSGRGAEQVQTAETVPSERAKSPPTNRSSVSAAGATRVLENKKADASANISSSFMSSKVDEMLEQEEDLEEDRVPEEEVLVVSTQTVEVKMEYKAAPRAKGSNDREKEKSSSFKASAKSRSLPKARSSTMVTYTRGPASVSTKRASAASYYNSPSEKSLATQVANNTTQVTSFIALSDNNEASRTNLLHNESMVPSTAPHSQVLTGPSHRKRSTRDLSNTSRGFDRDEEEELKGSSPTAKMTESSRRRSERNSSQPEKGKRTAGSATPVKKSRDTEDSTPQPRRQTLSIDKTPRKGPLLSKRKKLSELGRESPPPNN